MRGTLLLAAMLIAAPVHAKTTYAAYEGLHNEYVGDGGTKMDMKGVELWTSGRPPRKFKVLGIITDVRKDKVFSGDPLNSTGIANKAREVGADALIVYGQDSEAVGFRGTANSWSNGTTSFGNNAGRVVHERTTRFAAIKYLE